jgi:hypothetical protein
MALARSPRALAPIVRERSVPTRSAQQAHSLQALPHLQKEQTHSPQ